jgi:predicted permease
MPIIMGRALSARDVGPAHKVAVINQTMARIYFPDTSPIGRTFNVGRDAQWQNIKVVGVAKDGKYMRLREKPIAAAWYPHAQQPQYLYRFMARYTGSAAVPSQIRQAFAEIDPNLPVSDVTTLRQLVNDSVLNQRLVAQLSTIFAALAAFLACIGIYGVMSYGVAQRTNELGVRMALGADRRALLWMVLREALGLVAIGVAAGLALALAAGRLVESALFGMRPFDPVAIAVATVSMTAVALAAGYLPARRATRIDPLAALRHE